MRTVSSLVGCDTDSWAVSRRTSELEEAFSAFCEEYSLDWDQVRFRIERESSLYHPRSLASLTLCSRPDQHHSFVVNPYDSLCDLPLDLDELEEQEEVVQIRREPNGQSTRPRLAPEGPLLNPAVELKGESAGRAREAGSELMSLTGADG